jgi:hypothetical protein
MKKLIIQIAMLGLGIFITYTFGRDAFLPIRYRLTGTVVEGRISGFLAGRGSGTVLTESDGVRSGKRRARKPVFVYPASASGMDSLESRSSTAALTLISNYKMHERVTVVYHPDQPQEAYLFGFQIITGALLCVILGLYACKIGVTGRL